MGRQRRGTGRGQQGRRQDAVRLRRPAPGARCPAHGQRARRPRPRRFDDDRPRLSLPATAEPRGPPRRSVEDPQLAPTIRLLARAFPGICGVYVQDLRTGAGAAWNAGARPAASTVKVAIAIEVLRRLGGKPPRGSRIDALLRKAIIPSDDRAANDLLTWLGGSTSGGAAYVNQLFRALGMDDTACTAATSSRRADPDPRGRSTELRRQADDGGRPRDADALAEPRRGRAGPAGSAWLPAVAGVSPLPARALAGEPDRPSSSGPDRGPPEGRLDQHRPARQRHRLWSGGSFVATVLTWNGRGVGVASDVLAGRTAPRTPGLDVADYDEVLDRIPRALPRPS